MCWCSQHALATIAATGEGNDQHHGLERFLQATCPGIVPTWDCRDCRNRCWQSFGWWKNGEDMSTESTIVWFPYCFWRFNCCNSEKGILIYLICLIYAILSGLGPKWLQGEAFRCRLRVFPCQKQWESRVPQTQRKSKEREAGPEFAILLTDSLGDFRKFLASWHFIYDILWW